MCHRSGTVYIVILLVRPKYRQCAWQTSRRRRGISQTALRRTKRVAPVKCLGSYVLFHVWRGKKETPAWRRHAMGPHREDYVDTAFPGILPVVSISRRKAPSTLWLDIFFQEQLNSRGSRVTSKLVGATGSGGINIVITATKTRRVSSHQSRYS